MSPRDHHRGVGEGGVNVKGKLGEGGGVGRTALKAGVPKMNTDGVEGTEYSPVLLEERYLFVPRVIADGKLASGGDHVGLHRRGWKREMIGRVRPTLEVE